MTEADKDKLKISQKLELAAMTARSNDLIAGIEEALRPHVDRVRGFIDKLNAEVASKGFGSYDDNREAARALSALVTKAGLCLLCPECRRPAEMTVFRQPRYPTGVYRFSHIDGPLARHSRVAWPEMEVVVAEEKAPDQQRSIG